MGIKFAKVVRIERDEKQVLFLKVAVCTESSSEFGGEMVMISAFDRGAVKVNITVATVCCAIISSSIGS